MIKNSEIDFYRINAYFCAMLRIKKVKTKSGSTDMQVVQYTGHSAKIVKHIGSSRDDIEHDLLINKAQEWIGKCTMQSNLFPGKSKMC